MKLITKFNLAIQSMRLSAKYLYYCIFSNSKCHDKNGFIVTLTTYGSRLNFVFLTIETILQQQYKPEKIVLWLYKNDRPKGLSRFLLNRQSKRGLLIKYVDKDVRSYKKLSFVRQYFLSAQFFITADDDVIYPSDWLEGFRKAVARSSDRIYCYRGRIISFDEGYTQWNLASKRLFHGDNLMPTGVSGVCYPARSLDDRIADFESIERICPYADDIWYKLLTKSNGFVSELVETESIHFTPSLSGFRKGLEKLNVLNDLNTQQFNDSMRYFNLTRDDFRKQD
ncbi:hypothetical protein [Siccibacter turicensis]|uniref:hypothetical protein n=1 Tax=Siccibacter turicensis TaxID=357233 RepID=UPI00102011A4|nr:hypothetical protein [Siccibacter turicensis]